ncbi:protein fantom [Caerostris extrusa]|uniref:Protein fantom n=1 Tax=Caerostris extrusa TaxID=172846 RepID=A0AAV4NBM1_CAEEX|nr:protein fantom [Caerostris extrusa]
MQAQYNDMEDKMRILKLNHDHLVKDMDDLALRFKNEQKKNFELLGELKKAEVTFSASSELQERIKSLTKQNDILRETNEKLLNSALIVEKERSYNQLEQVFLKRKISGLEYALEMQNLETKIRVLKSEDIKFDDLQEALELLKLKREGKLENIDNATHKLNDTDQSISERRKKFK